MDTLPPFPPPVSFIDSPLRHQHSNNTTLNTSMNTDQAQAHFHPHHPFVRCPTTLLAAVQTNPEHIFTRLLSLIEERDTLKRDLLSLNEDFAHARKDWKCAREKYEELVDIGLAKQVVLWKYVERLGGGGDGNGGLIGDETRCKRGMSETSEISEGSSEGGGWSWAGEGKGMGLDPNAVSSFFFPSFLFSLSFDSQYNRIWNVNIRWMQQTFTPRFGSPPKYYEEPSNYSPPTPPAISLNHPSLSPSPSPNNLRTRLSDTTLKSLIATLPPRFYGICPHSLTTDTPCPLPKCNLQQLCPEYNDLNKPSSTSPGSKASNSCTNVACLYVHEYRTCENEANGEVCRFVSGGGSWGGYWNKRKRIHGCKRLHERLFGGCGKREWEARCLVSSLRGEHREGRY